MPLSSGSNFQFSFTQRAEAVPNRAGPLMGTMSTIRPFFTVISRRTGSRITEGDTTGDGLVAIESCCPESPPAKAGGGWLQRKITVSARTAPLVILSQEGMPGVYLG